jgi:phage terminase large subunit-like protein
MTSVLTMSGLNYQGGNPLRLMIESLRRDIDALKVVVEEQKVAMQTMSTTAAAGPAGPPGPPGPPGPMAGQ